MISRLPLCLLLTLPALACSSGGLDHTVQDDKLANISAESRAEIAGAESALQSAKERAERAEGVVSAAELELVRSKSDLQVTEKRLDTLDDIKDAAEKAKDEERVTETEETKNALEALKEAQEKDVELQESRVQYAELNRDSAKAQVEVAAAQLEEVRAQAVYQATQDSADRVKMADYKIQVSKKLEKASDLELKSAKAFKSMEENRAAYEEELAKVPDAIGAAEKALSKTNKKNDDLSRQLEQLKGQVGALEANNTKLQKTLEAGRESLGTGEEPQN